MPIKFILTAFVFSVFELLSTALIFAGEKPNLFICPKAWSPNKGVRIYTKPKTTDNFHILNQNGKSLYIGRLNEKPMFDAMEDKEVTGWFVEPNDENIIKQIPSIAIVVETTNKKPYREIQSRKIQLSSSDVYKYFKNIKPAAITLPKDIKFQAIFAGTDGKKDRVLLLVWKDVFMGVDNRIASVLEIQNNNLTELYTYQVDSGGELPSFSFKGMADLNYDGFADVFLLYFGDYGGEVLLMALGMIAFEVI